MPKLQESRMEIAVIKPLRRTCRSLLQSERSATWTTRVVKLLLELYPNVSILRASTTQHRQGHNRAYRGDAVTCINARIMVCKSPMNTHHIYMDKLESCLKLYKSSLGCN
jgi:hypothetical protein